MASHDIALRTPTEPGTDRIKWSMERAWELEQQSSRPPMQSMHNGQPPVPEGKLEVRHSDPVTNSATFTTPEAGDEGLGDLLLGFPTGFHSGHLSAQEVQRWIESQRVQPASGYTDQRKHK